jgi:predicted DsbA family dithiol-disulfide isomerase
LRHAFAGRISWRYVLGGMIADWQQFNDPLHSVARPAQMGPHWFEIRHRTGMPIDERIWMEDPPGSSYPACLAVKAAGFQGQPAEEAFLRRTREAVMLERRNVARRDVLLGLGLELAETGSLDFDRFRADLSSPAAEEAFREDLRDTRYREIGRFPTLLLRHGGRTVGLMGYRPYPALLEAVAAVAPGEEPTPAPDDALSYALSWGRITASEIAAGLGTPAAGFEQRLGAAVEDGVLTRQGPLYMAPTSRT